MKPEQDKPQSLPSGPVTKPDSIDAIGKVPKGIRIDPDITEGHPGYEESGDSEIIPPDRLTSGGHAVQK